MGKVDSSLCSFCKVTNETITHIFCGCNKIKISVAEDSRLVQASFVLARSFT